MAEEDHEAVEMRTHKPEMNGENGYNLSAI